MGAVAGCHWIGCMVRCHCWVPCGKAPLLGAIGSAHVGGLDVVPLLGAIG